MYLKLPNVLTLKLSKMLGSNPKEERACRTAGRGSRMQFCELGAREFHHLTNEKCRGNSLYSLVPAMLWMKQLHSVT